MLTTRLRRCSSTSRQHTALGSPRCSAAETCERAGVGRTLRRAARAITGSRGVGSTSRRDLPLRKRSRTPRQNRRSPVRSRSSAGRGHTRRAGEALLSREQHKHFSASSTQLRARPSRSSQGRGTHARARPPSCVCVRHDASSERRQGQGSKSVWVAIDRRTSSQATARTRSCTLRRLAWARLGRHRPVAVSNALATLFLSTLARLACVSVLTTSCALRVTRLHAPAANSSLRSAVVTHAMSFGGCSE
jgi:hypothetical protein